MSVEVIFCLHANVPIADSQCMALRQNVRIVMRPFRSCARMPPPLAAPKLGAEQFAAGYFVCFLPPSFITSQVVTAGWNFLSQFSLL